MKGLRKWILFDYANVLLMLFMMVITAYPMIFAIAGAFSEGNDYMRGGIYFYPRKPTLDNFRVLFRNNQIIQAFKISAMKSIIGTFTNLIVTLLVAYAMTRPDLKLKRVYQLVIMVPMFFGGGLIPYFMLIRDLGLYDTFLVYIIPGMFSIWTMLIMQSYIRGLPDSIIESAEIDGAGEYMILARIVAPLCVPMFAALILFGVVGHWNSYFDSMMFTTRTELQTIQYYLRKIIVDVNQSNSMYDQAIKFASDIKDKPIAQTLKLAAMVTTAAPILAVYPFLQRYFVKGITLGSIKG